MMLTDSHSIHYLGFLWCHEKKCSAKVDAKSSSLLMLLSSLSSLSSASSTLMMSHAFLSMPDYKFSWDIELWSELYEILIPRPQQPYLIFDNLKLGQNSWGVSCPKMCSWAFGQNPHFLVLGPLLIWTPLPYGSNFDQVHESWPLGLQAAFSQILDGQKFEKLRSFYKDLEGDLANVPNV